MNTPAIINIPLASVKAAEIVDVIDSRIEVYKTAGILRSIQRYHSVEKTDDHDDPFSGIAQPFERHMTFTHKIESVHGIDYSYYQSEDAWAVGITLTNERIIYMVNTEAEAKGIHDELNALIFDFHD